MMLFLLISAHFLADYPLQGDFLALNKSRRGPNYVPWWQELLAHSFIHGGFVEAITGLWWLGLLEVAIHASTDHLKFEKRIGINADQLIHIACTFIWSFIAMVVIK